MSQTDAARMRSPTFRQPLAQDGVESQPDEQETVARVAPTPERDEQSHEEERRADGIGEDGTAGEVLTGASSPGRAFVMRGPSQVEGHKPQKLHPLHVLF